MTEAEGRLKDFLSSINRSVEIPQESALDAFYEIKRMSNDRKEILKVRLTNDAPAIIIPVGDIHFGNKTCNIDKLAKILQLILRTPNCYTILIGDLAETATKESVGNAMFDEDFHYPDQIKILTAALKPLVKAGKVLGAITGNHEMRIEYLTGLNPMALLAEKLDIPYFGFQGFIEAKVGDQTYQIMCHHGVGGGSTPAGRVKAAHKLSDVAQADLYISGHTHGCEYEHDEIMVFNDGYMESKTRHFVVAGSFLNYWGGYAEMKLLQPAKTGSVFIELRHDAKEIRAFV
jgi:predicted phosphodiesterase